MTNAFQPLAGVTVVAWEQAVSLPMATRLWADLGATVLRIDSHVRTRQRARHLGNDLVRNKLSLALDLRSARGQKILKSLVSEAGTFCENYTPRVKRHFSLTWDDLRAEREDLIMLSLTGYGQTGEWAERPTFGPGIEAASGHALSAGLEESPPTRPGTVVYADNVSGFYAAFALLAALERRKTTGQGQYIDLSMYEANVHHLTVSLMSSSISGQPALRRGNTDPTFVLQQVLPASEPDSWLAVSVRADRCDALRQLLGAPADADLAAALSIWVRTRTAIESATQLQAIGIASSPAATARDVLRDPQLRHRGALSLIRHDRPVNGYAAHPHMASPWWVEGRTRPALREAPAVGQDSRLVLSQWLGMTDQEVESLIADGVVGVPNEDLAVPLGSFHAPPAEGKSKLEWRVAAGYDEYPEEAVGLTVDGRLEP